MKVLSHTASPCCLPQVFFPTHIIPPHPTIIYSRRIAQASKHCPLCPLLPTTRCFKTNCTHVKCASLPLCIWDTISRSATISSHHTHPGLQNSGLRPQKVLQTQQEVLPCILPPLRDKVKFSTRDEDRAAAPQLQSPHYHDCHHSQGTLGVCPPYSQDAECEGPRHALAVSHQEAAIAARPSQQLLRSSAAQVTVIPGRGRAA